MASKKTSKGGDSSFTKPAAGNVKLADIQTASKGAMEPHDYSGGYPTQPGTLWNGRTITRTKDRK